MSLTALFAFSLLGSSEAGTILPSIPKKHLLNESYLSSSIEYRLDYINFMTWDEKLTDFYKLQNPIYFTIREGVITLSNSYSKTRVFKIFNKEDTDMGVKYGNIRYHKNGKRVLPVVRPLILKNGGLI